MRLHVCFFVRCFVCLFLSLVNELGNEWVSGCVGAYVCGLVGEALVHLTLPEVVRVCVCVCVCE